MYSINFSGRVNWVSEQKNIGDNCVLTFIASHAETVRMDRYPTAKPSSNGYGYIYLSAKCEVWGKQNQIASLQSRIEKGSIVIVKDAKVVFDVATGGPKTYTDKNGNVKASYELRISPANIEVATRSASSSVSEPQTISAVSQAQPQAQSQESSAGATYDIAADWDIDCPF